MNGVTRNCEGDHHFVVVFFFRKANEIEWLNH